MFMHIYLHTNNMHIINTFMYYSNNKTDIIINKSIAIPTNSPTKQFRH